MERFRQVSVSRPMMRLLLFLFILVTSGVPLKGQFLSPSYHQRSLRPIQIKVRQIYTSQIGIREKQPNAGAAVEQYLSYVHLSKGHPWCAAFVCWVLGKAGVDNPRTGWSPALFPAAKVVWKRGDAMTDKKPQPGTGDVFGIYFSEKGRIAHAGFVDQWDGTWLVTVEGNTNENGSREGDGVYRKRRMVRTIYRVARYIK